MADPIIMEPRPALDATGHVHRIEHEAAYALTIGTVTIVAIDGRAIRTVAFEPAQGQTLERLVSVPLPSPGTSVTTPEGPRLLGVQRDQLWLLDGEHPTAGSDHAPDTSSGTSSDTSSTNGLWWVDQSDGWTTLAIEGEDVLAVLERLCPVDLNAHVFPVDAVARTVIEHLAVVIVRTGNHRFELLTPRSSVQSFAQALEHAAGHVEAEHTLRSSSARD